MLVGSIPSFQFHILTPTHLEVTITEPHRVVLVHLSFQFVVAGETVRLREEHDFLDGANLGCDMEQLQNVVLRQRSVSLHAQHLGRDQIENTKC